LLALAIALVAANLRPALASVGPVLADIRADLALSAALAALLTALPVACLGAFAPASPGLARRWGIEPVLAVVLGALVAGLVVRVTDGVVPLFAGSLLAAAAIAVANVLLPALIKRDFPRHSGTMMGVYTMALTGAAALAAGVTAPLEHALGWRGGLGFWALPAAVALVAWLPFARGRTAPALRRPGRSLLGDPVAWQVTVFFGSQSLSFYAVLGWLPTLYRDDGYSASAAGLVLSVSALAQMPVALLLPRFATPKATQRRYTVGATLCTAIGLAGIFAAPAAAPYLWAVVLGIGQGAGIATGLTLIVVRTRSTADATGLSALAQTVGYLIAAGGPFLFGAAYQAIGDRALLLLLALLLPQLIVGVLAGRHHFVHGGAADAGAAGAGGGDVSGASGGRPAAGG
jgi:CP family cyanate transporter-like MFS transporter